MEVDTLDVLLHGGLPAGNSVLVQGAPGTGKTILGMQFLYGGITRHEEPGLFVTFEEAPRRLHRDARALGWDFEGLERDHKLLIVYTSAAVFLKELESDTYSRLCRDYGLKRVVVDSLAHFETLPNDAQTVRVRFERIVNALRREGLTVLMTRETETREPTGRVTPEEYLADTILQLNYALLGERRARLIEVLKHRGSPHSPSQHRFVIAEGGFQILATADGNG
jgi:circadian clock protein KaiC